MALSASRQGKQIIFRSPLVELDNPHQHDCGCLGGKKKAVIESQSIRSEAIPSMRVSVFDAKVQ